MKNWLTRLVCYGCGLILLTIAGCTSNSPIPGDAHALYPAPDLGIMTDENFKVVDMIRPGPALVAGVEVGDVLLDITWIPSDERIWLPESSDVVYVDREGYVVDPVGNPYVDATGRRLTVEDMFGAVGPGLPTQESVEPDQTALPEATAVSTQASMTEQTPAPTPTVVLPISVAVQPGSPIPVPSVGPRAADVIEKDTIPFTAENVSRVSSLAAYGVPLLLRLQRGDEVLEFTITPTSPAVRVIEAAPDAPTPISSAYYF